MAVFINVADLKVPGDPQGRSYREVNAARAHAIPVGSLVELPDGVRLFVVDHHRDCDQTPLYALSWDQDIDIKTADGRFWLKDVRHGIPEDFLRVVTKRPGWGKGLLDGR